MCVMHCFFFSVRVLCMLCVCRCFFSYVCVCVFYDQIHDNYVVYILMSPSLHSFPEFLSFLIFEANLYSFPVPCVFILDIVGLSLVETL